MMDLLEEERQAYAAGINTIAGVDEVGRGCLAGPVYAAAVILPRNFDLPELNDSKKLTAAKREILFEQISQQAVNWKVAWVDVEEIDQINIFHAALKAMALALNALPRKPELTLVDGKFKVPMDVPQKTLVKGDGRSASIAAASIMAKVSRDQFMSSQDEVFPGYHFARHKGYGTALHRKALRKLGVTPLHRHSFAPVSELVDSLGGT